MSEYFRTMSPSGFSPGYGNVDPTATGRILLAKQVQSATTDDLNGLASDPYLTGMSKETGMAQSGEIEVCRILYAMPGTYWYHASRPYQRGTIGLSDTNTTGNIFAVQNYTLYPPGTMVVAFIPPGSPYGTILGVMPLFCYDGALNWSGYVSVGSNNGVYKSYPHVELSNNTTVMGNVMNWAGSRPLDSTAMGEFGFASALGGGIHLDNFMFYSKISEQCGFWLFHMDQLMRLRTYNYEMQTYGYSREFKNDEGELYEYSGHAVYPWEAMGFLSKDRIRWREVSDSDFLYVKPEGKFEPQTMDQVPFYRIEQYGGYLGQGSYLQVVTPGQGTGPNTLSNKRYATGLFRETIGLDGSYLLESAHSIQIVKRALIRVPKRIEQIESPDGDDKQKSSGYDFNHENAELKSNLYPPGPDKGLKTINGLSDVEAYSAEYRMGQAFQNHEKDFHVPDNEEVYPSIVQKKLDVSTLYDKPFLETISPEQVHIDDRYGDADIYPTEAGVFFTDDGGVVLRGGGGCEIKLVNGNVFISCPGNVHMLSGKDTVIMSGDDTVIKSYNSCDITSTRKDVRIKAEHNLDIVSGVGREGRLLLENKGYGMANDTQQVGLEGEDIRTSGIFIKSDEAGIYNYSSQYYLKTTSPGEAICLDASTGNGNIVTSSRYISHTVATGMQVGIVPYGTSQTTNILNFFPTQFSVSVPYTIFQGDLTVGRNVEAGLNLYSAAGHVYTKKAEEEGSYVYVWPRNDKQRKGPTAEEYVQRNMDGLNNTMSDYSTEVTTLWDDRIHGEGRYGSVEFVNNCEFSYRNEKQYNTENYVLPTVYWQDISDIGTTTWNERDFTYQSFTQMPYPGYNKWAVEETMQSMEPQLYDPDTGSFSDDPTVYDDYQPGDWVKQVPNNNYKIIQTGY